MLLLAFDTAGPDCAVALACSEPGDIRILARREERIGRGHAERLMPMIEAALADAGSVYTDLQRIAVTTGPGSFTGVRVGVAAARALALALAVPAIGVGTLSALAVPAARAHRSGTAVALLDAKRGEIYALAQDVSSGAIVLEATAGTGEAIASRLSAAMRPLILCGSGAPILAAALPRSAFRIDGAAENPDIADVAALGAVAEASGPPIPLYLRGADAKSQAGKALARA